MASIYGGKYSRGSSRGGSIYGGKYSGGKSKGKKGASPLGFAENLLGDVGEAIVGLPAGLKEFADPFAHYARGDLKGGARESRQVVGGVAGSYAHTYGPLLRGNVGEFAHRVYQNPLGPILDLATVASLGVAGAVKAGALPARVEVTLRSPGALAGQGGKTITKSVSKKQAALDKFMRQFPADAPVVGEFARYAKELERIPRKEALSLQVKLRPYQKAYKRLSEGEQIALGLIGRGVHPKQYKALLEREAANGSKIEPGMLKLLDRKDVIAAYDSPSPRLMDAVEKGRAAGETAADVLVARGRLHADTAEARPYLHVNSLDEARSIPELQEMFDEAGRPQPFYLPDKAVSERSFLGRAGGGFGVPRSPVAKNEGILFRSGMLALQPDMLSSSYLRTVRYALHHDIHEELMAAAVRVGKGDSLPEGFEYIRRPVGKHGTTPERISYTQKNAGDFRRDLDELIPEGDQNGASLGDFTTTNAAEAAADGEHFLAIPKQLKERAAGEFQRNEKPIRWFIQKPTAVWRALVLNLRPAWLVNNIVGNHMLYAVRYAGPNGLRSYANAVKEAGKETTEFKRLVEKHFPEQIEGTFINTQRPGKRQRAQNVASLGLAPADKAVEGLLRNAAVRAELRKAPQIKARMKAMQRETRSFENAAEAELAGNPELVRLVGEKVNRALGDFLHLSPFERNYLRTIAPFYAWYKAITGIVVRFPLDYPGRAALLSRLGQLGAEETIETLGDIPSYLRGAIPLSVKGDSATILNTTGLNPAGTLTGLGADISGTINPVIAGLARSILAESRYETVSPVRAVGRAGHEAAQTVSSLPQFRLAAAATGRLYKGEPGKPTLYNRDPIWELLAYMGVPVKELNRAAAAEKARREREGGR